MMAIVGVPTIVGIGPRPDLALIRVTLMRRVSLAIARTRSVSVFGSIRPSPGA